MIAGFYFLVKSPFLPPYRIKKVRISVSQFRAKITHRNVRIVLIIKLFNN